MNPSRLFGRITKGQLRIITSSRTYSFPEKTPLNDDEPQVELGVVRDSFWTRLCIMSDLGFSEAFMYGDVECDDLVSLFKVSTRLSCQSPGSQLVLGLSLQSREPWRV